MSPVPRAHHTEVLISYPCPTCGVGPGDWCVTMTGQAKHEFHVARTILASENGWQFPDVRPE